ncbi:MAG: peptide-binding protein [Pedobacter sp.]|nr:MAG: peptide-binding protein [Pedobacter sp.]
MKSPSTRYKLGLFTVLFAVTSVISCVQNCFSQQFEFPGRRTRDKLGFEMIKNLVIIPLYINNTGPYNFILDTGVSPMIITDPTIISGLEIKSLRPTKISGLGKGPDIDALLTNEIKASIGKSSISNLPAAILKEDILGLSNYVGIKIHGLIGFYFFNSFVVHINYSSKNIRFHLHSNKSKIKGEKVPFQMIQNKPYINVSTYLSEKDAVVAKVLVDNGAGHAISLETYHDKPFPLPEKTAEANLGNGLSGPISGKIGRIYSLQIGSFKLKNVISSFPVYDDAGAKAILLNRNGNLGAELLSKFNVVFDYKNQEMYIRKNTSFNVPFEHDMSGMEIYTDDANKRRYFVLRIEPGSPAEESEMKLNDEILALNFSTTQQMNLNEITKILKSGDGRTLFLTINRGGKMMYKFMKLKRRI